ncbi:hypothetical protein MPPM_3923 [Methylorubrum populi]|uniref:Uncharacterized protein n=1 Tax=Methylorubrum populi TaxID=223967 RepID=A0A169RB96_9HYPH|nr:hypothetical protein [Methylorubrum populi]BAU92528.1 hypothetical protein MPPM_3923 [Methylorubrum populi]
MIRSLHPAGRVGSRHFAPARIALAAFATLLLALPAAARGPDFDFPAEVAGFARGPRTDYEARAPGLGYSVVYTNGRWKADIYVYDGSVANIPDGPSSPTVTGQLAQAATDIGTAVAQGVYRGSEDRGAVRVPGPAGARLACRGFTIDHPALGPTESLLCLTGLRGKFVKFRLSGPAAKQPPRAEAERFMTVWLGRQ